MNLIPIIERLMDKCPQYEQAEMSLAFGMEQQSYPVIQVVPGSEYADPDETITSGHIQTITADFGVLIACNAPNLTTRVDELSDVLLAVRSALAGYFPADNSWVAPCTFVRGEPVNRDAGAILWRDAYSVRYLLSV